MRLSNALLALTLSCHLQNPPCVCFYTHLDSLSQIARTTSNPFTQPREYCSIAERGRASGRTIYLSVHASTIKYAWDSCGVRSIAPRGTDGDRDWEEWDGSCLLGAQIPIRIKQFNKFLRYSYNLGNTEPGRRKPKAMRQTWKTWGKLTKLGYVCPQWCTSSQELQIPLNWIPYLDHRHPFFFSGLFI